MSEKATRLHAAQPRDWRPYFSRELKAELDEFFAEHPELDQIGSMERWIRKGAAEHRRRHGRAVGA